MKVLRVVFGLLCFIAMGCGPLSAEGEPGEVGSTRQALLPAPSGVLATPIRGGIQLTWPAVSGATQYVVYSRTVDGTYYWGPTARTWTVNTTSFFDSSTAEQYYYVVTALDSSGGESGYSPEVTATGWANLALGKTAVQSTTWGSAVAGLAVDGNTDGYFNNGSVSSTDWWNNNQFQSWRVDLGSVKSLYYIDVWATTSCCESLTNYQIFYSSENTTNPSPASWVPGPAFADAAGRPTRAQAMPISARHVMIQRQVLDRALILAEVEVWGTDLDTTPPSTPPALTATYLIGGSIKLKWVGSTDNVGVWNYSVERCDGPGCTDFEEVKTVLANQIGPNWTNNQLAFGTTYRYRVRARDYSGRLSGYSNVAGLTTPF
jgi:hypothetical protein